MNNDRITTSGPPISNTTETLRWMGDMDGYLRMIDQTLLPTEFIELDCREVETVWEAIRQLRVRGAPAIGIAAAYGVVLGLQGFRDSTTAEFTRRLEEVCQYLATSRPTAVNLFWALDRMRRCDQTPDPKDASSGETADTRERSPAERLARLLAEARAIHDEDREMCHAIGRWGAELLTDGASVLTHCNAGGLATAEYGTALSVIFTAQDQGKKLHVFVDETRPLLQGARLTAWELAQRDVSATLICDSMAAQVMREGRVQAVITGADRITARGDTANKIGTYGLSVLAAAHQIPFYVAAPSSTFDFSIERGEEIPIEQRDGGEITCGFGRQTAPLGFDVYNPAFDVTPAENITAIITEFGRVQPVNKQEIARVLKR
jgi:methylthioribose-1-phosphate isomerase